MTSLIDYDSNSLSQELDSSQTNSGESPQTNLLELAWQARWLIQLTILIGIGGAWIVLQRVEQRFSSQSRIYIERNVPQFLSNDMQLAKSSSYLYTQAQLIGSTSVLMAVINAPENSQLEAFRGAENPLGFLKENIQVGVGQEDDIINVSLEITNAEEAAQIVNSVVDAYISLYAEERRSTTVDVLNILRKEKQSRDAELDLRLEALEKFRSQNAALAVQVGNENVITKRFAALATELDRVELDLLDSKTRNARTQKMFESPSQRPFLLEVASNQRSVLQDVRTENMLELNLKKQIYDIELQLSTLRATWSDGHTRVKLLLEAKETLEQRLVDHLAKMEERKKTVVLAYVESIKQEYQLLEQKRAGLQKSYNVQFELAVQVNSQAAKLATLESSLARTERLVEILVDRIKEVNLSENVGAMNVSIMEVAAPSSKASYPSQARFLAIGAFLGGLFGFGVAWLRDLLDHRLKSMDEIAAVLQLPVLGALPFTEEQKERFVTGKIVLLQPRSAAAESFRTLRTAIHFGLTRDEAKVIAVTSPSPGDGKSTVASNLALTMAQADQRVLLIDADMRKPKQHEIFEVTASSGLSAVLAERRPASELILATEFGSLDLLPCGAVPPNPVELLNNGYFAEFLLEMQEIYDKIIIDAPPVLPVADARVISAQTDATILVLRAERSTRRISLAARDELWRVRAPRIGVVVNAVPARKQSDYVAGYGYGYGNYGYSAGSYGDVAYGKTIDQSPKKSRALPTASPLDEALEPADIEKS